MSLVKMQSCVRRPFARAKLIPRVGVSQGLSRSRWDHAIFGGIGGGSYPRDEMLRILFPRFENITDEDGKSRAIRDAMHLATHYMYRRDFFVTLDMEHFIAHRDALKERFGVVILTPEECVSRLSKMLWSEDEATSLDCSSRRGPYPSRPLLYWVASFP